MKNNYYEKVNLSNILNMKKQKTLFERFIYGAKLA